MRLLQIAADNELSLTKDYVDDIPPYAILSHVWEKGDNDEVTFQDIEMKSWEDKIGYQKILFCGRQAQRDGLNHFWMDTCCINKTSSNELTEAVNSMFEWYQRAEKCYVYLADVSDGYSKTSEPSRSTWKTSFRKSKWFTRGWTLQELIAPPIVEFYSQEGHKLGDKGSLEQTIHEITGIPVAALQGVQLSSFSSEERISWSNGRETTRVEDKAYSLLGLLGLKMHVLYSEGEEKAFKRLRREISEDQGHQLRDTELETRLNECLKNLQVVDPRDVKFRIESIRGGLVKESYRAVFKHDVFNQLRQAKNHGHDNRLLWIRGDPGKGKTMLICGVIDEWNTLSETESMVSYFFCQATDANLNNVTAVIRGLVFMLVEQDRYLLKQFYDEVQMSGKEIFQDANRLFKILAAMLRTYSKREPVFIIDALDECSEGLSKLLNFIAQTSSDGKAKWIVSSRNRQNIKQQLETANWNKILSLELNKSSISDAISIYIRHKIDHLQRMKGFDNAKRHDIMEYIVSKADYTYLWIALVYKLLEDSRLQTRHLLKELQKFSPDLNSLYKRMIAINYSLEGEIYHKILTFVSSETCPVSLQKLMTILDDTADFDNVDTLRDCVRSCGLLAIHEDIVHFVHQSAKEFLLGEEASVSSTIMDSEQYTESIHTIVDAVVGDYGKQLLVNDNSACYNVRGLHGGHGTVQMIGNLSTTIFSDAVSNL